MAGEWMVGFVLLTLPLLAGVGLLIFMMSGRGDAKTTDEILAHRHTKMKERDELHEEDFDLEKT
jgi:thymidine phosphorylase